MKEVLRNSEKRTKGAPIDIIFGQMDPDELKLLDKRIDERMRDSSGGKIAVVLAQGKSTEKFSDVFEKAMDNCISPMNAYFLACFAEKNNRLPCPSNPDDLPEILNIALSLDIYTHSLLNILTEKHEKYNGNIRLKFNYVGEDRNSFNEYINRFKVNNIKKYESASVFQTGNFDKAVVNFREYVEFSANDVDKSNKKMCAQIAKLADDRDTSAVIVLTELINTRLRSELIKNGYNVSRVFPDKDIVKASWGNFLNRAIRTRLLLPDKEITDMNWYRYMLGYALENYFVELQRTVKQEISIFDENKAEKVEKTSKKDYFEEIKNATKLARIKLKSLNTMESIRKFESQVKDGFEFAIAVYPIPKEQ